MTAPIEVEEGVQARGRLFVAALVSGFAGIIHISVVPEHLSAWWGYGAFFLMVGAAQLISGAALLRRARPWLLSVMTAGNAAVILVYVVSRTIGASIGPGHGGHGGHEIEPSGPHDLAATAAEVVLVAALLPVLPTQSRRIMMNLLLACGLGLWLLKAVGRLG